MFPLIYYKYIRIFHLVGTFLRSAFITDYVNEEDVLFCV